MFPSIAAVLRRDRFITGNIGQCVGHGKRLRV